MRLPNKQTTRTAHDYWGSRLNPQCESARRWARPPAGLKDGRRRRVTPLLLGATPRDATTSLQGRGITRGVRL